MARRDPIDYESLHRLLDLAMTRLEVTQPDAFAVAIGLAHRSVLTEDKRARDLEQVRRVREWTQGRRAPQVPELLAILTAADLLAPEAVAAWEGVSLAEARRRVDAARPRAVAEARAMEAAGSDLGAHEARPRRTRRSA